MSEKPCPTGTSRLPVVKMLIRVCPATCSKPPYTLTRVCGKPGRSVAPKALALWENGPTTLDSKADGRNVSHRLKRARRPGSVGGAQRLQPFRPPACRGQRQHSNDGRRG